MGNRTNRQSYLFRTLILLNYRMSVLGQRILLGCLVYLENLVKTYKNYTVKSLILAQDER